MLDVMLGYLSTCTDIFWDVVRYRISFDAKQYFTTVTGVSGVVADLPIDDL